MMSRHMDNYDVTSHGVTSYVNFDVTSHDATSSVQCINEQPHKWMQYCLFWKNLWRSYTRAHMGPGPGEFLIALVNHVRSTYLNPCRGVTRNGHSRARPDRSKIKLTL